MNQTIAEFEAQAQAPKPGLNSVAPPKLNPEQEVAVTAMIRWLRDPDAPSFFVLRGFAGTGKTFSVKVLIDRIKGKMTFTAPTNKATKVIRDSFEGTGYKPECRTIYSLLGLRLEANGEVKELTKAQLKKGEEPLDLSEFLCIVVDEAGMTNSMLFHDHIRRAAEMQGARFLFMGDPAQLPPVKELRSPIWDSGSAEAGNGAELSTPMRHDNQILKLCTSIRGKVDHPAPTIKLASDNDGIEGVWYESRGIWLRRMGDLAREGLFHKPNGAKAIAWRNITVDQLNAIIRGQYFPEVTSPWVEEDRVIFTEPAKNLDDEIIATTDDEGRIARVQEAWHPVYGDIKTYTIAVDLDTGGLVTARVLHPDSRQAFDRKVEELAAAARANPRRWGEFWGFKEAFHNLRLAYAITAHRSQGSTYDTTFVDVQDVLLNRNRQEAYRCLYVACSRPKKRLFLA